MKKLFLGILLAFFSILGNAEVKRESNTFVVEQTITEDIQTPYFYKDRKGNKYPIYISKRGACYIIKISKKTGKEYKHYLPKEIQNQIKQELDIQ